MPNQDDFDLTTKEGRQAYREALLEENPELRTGGRNPVMLTENQLTLHRLTLLERIKELEAAIRLHRNKVQLVQTEDMELWAHLNDGEQ